MTKLILSIVSSILMCYTTSTAQSNLNPEFQIESEKTAVLKGEEFTVNVKVKNFKEILRLKGAITWKSDDYVFISANIQNLDFNLSTDLIGGNELLFTYIYNVKEANIADGASILKVKFSAKKNTAIKGICFNPEILRYEVLRGTATKPKLGAEVLVFKGLGAYCANFIWSYDGKGSKIIEPLESVLESNDLINANVKAYPNPSNDYLYFDLTTLQNIDNVDISLFDVQGKEITKLAFNANDLIKLDIHNLVLGTYFYKIITEKGVGSGKFVKI